MLPDSLRAVPQWLVSGEDKAPRSVKTGHYADVRDRTFYVSYDEAKAYADLHGLDVGFALTAEDPFTVIDLDAPDSPEQVARHQQIFEAFDTYAELSRSGKGVHIWCIGSVPRGARRDKVELYSADRYMICTGVAIKDRPIQNCQVLLDRMYPQVAQSVFEMADLVEEDAIITDQELFTMALNASNGEKFDRLSRGVWEGEYQSQSEADFALMNIICFYSKSNDQCRRLFRFSGLGRRDKAQRDKYLDYMISKIRAEAPPEIDFSGMTRQIQNGNNAHPENVAAHTDSVPQPVTVQTQPIQETTEERTRAFNIATRGRIPYPPGFIGEIASYIYESSVRPVKEVGISAALALVAGILGRQYNVSGTGLNQYLILIARTGVGKEGAASGIERILAEVRKQIPAVGTFVGPGTFASGQAIIRTLDDQHSFFSILGEFGLTLQMLSDPNIAGHMLVMRRVLLDLYTKSGRNAIVNSSAYSDREKNTKTLIGPALTIFGESTPELFYSGLSASHIADGLIPRFLIIEYTGNRPDKNPTAMISPDTGLVQRLCSLCETSLKMMANNSFHDVILSPEAAYEMEKFDKECDNHIREGAEESIRQLWNRAHLKSLRLAALLAAADRPHNPVVTVEEAQWAIEVVYKDTLAVAYRFEIGDVGDGDARQRVELLRALNEYLTRPLSEIAKYGVTQKMHETRVVPFAFIQRRTANLSAFRKDRRGGRAAVRDTVQELVDSSILIEVPKAKAVSDYTNYGKLYFITGGRMDDII